MISLQYKGIDIFRFINELSECQLLLQQVIACSDTG